MAGKIKFLTLITICAVIFSIAAVTPARAQDSFSFTMAGDYGYNDIVTATLAKIKEVNPTFHIANGDFSYDEITPESAWCNYVKSKLGDTFPFEIVTGNHEAGEPPGGNIDNFTPCLPHRMGSLAGTYGKEHYFDYQGARFIQISPGFEGPLLYDYSKGTSHYNWTLNAINSARSAGIKWIIVSMHENCITMGDKTCDIGPDIINMMIEKKVDLVLQGHDHTYQRSKQITLGLGCTALVPGIYNPNCIADAGSTFTKDAGTVFAIVGTGGAGLYSVNTSDSESGYFARWMGSNNQPRHGFLQVNISGSQLTAQFVGSTDTESSFADTFSITQSTSSPGTPSSPSPSTTILPSATPISSFEPIRLTEGNNYTDSSNNLWIHDTKADGGEIYTVNNTIANTSTPSLYQSERYGKDINYGFNVPNGKYQVKVKFSEIYFTQAGERVFNLTLNGSKVLDNFDILSETQPFTAIDKTYNVTVTDQKINLDFSTVKDNAKLASLEIIPLSQPTTAPSITPAPTHTPSPTASPVITPTPAPQSTFAPIRLNTGGNTTDNKNNLWLSDATTATGGTVYTTSSSVANTQNQSLFKSERYGKNFSYIKTVPNGTYTINFNFSEIYFTTVGSRVFNVDVNGTRVFGNYDILTQAAPFTALTKSYTLNVTAGQIKIDFSTVTDNAKIASLEIIQTGSSSSPTPSPSPTPTITPSPTLSPTNLPTSTPSPTVTPSLSASPTSNPSSSPTTNGLNAVYYDNKDFTSPVISRVDPKIYFDWLHAAPSSSMGVDNFSIRWTGYIVPRYSENYTFYTYSDDGVRLWINNSLIVDKWNDQGATEHTGTIVLQANQKYSFKMEYYENTGGANCEISWSSPSQPEQVIPQSQFLTQ